MLINKSHQTFVMPLSEYFWKLKKKYDSKDTSTLEFALIF